VARGRKPFEHPRYVSPEDDAYMGSGSLIPLLWWVHAALRSKEELKRRLGFSALVPAVADGVSWPMAPRRANDGEDAGR